MKQILYFILLILIFAVPLYAEEVEGSEEADETFFYLLNLNNRFEFKRNFLNSDDPSKLSFSEDGAGYYLYAGATFMWFVTDDTDLNLSLNSGILKLKNLYYENGETTSQINSMSPSEYAKKSLFIDEIYFNNDSAFKITAGKMNISNATDFVFNDYTFAARFEFDLYRENRKTLNLGIQYNTIDGYFNSDYKKSPFIMADISYKDKKRFNLTLFGSFLYDNDNSFGTLLHPFVAEFIKRKVSGNYTFEQTLTEVCGDDLSTCLKVDSSGYAIWSGIDLSGKIKHFTYRLTLIGNYGSMDIYPYLEFNGRILDIYAKKSKLGKLTSKLKYGDTSMEAGSGSGGTSSGSVMNNTLSTRKMLGFTAFSQIGYKFFSLLEISPYILFMSGDNDLEKSTYINSFVSVKSYITLSNIFFNGGLNETASSRNFSIAGVNGHGVINPGIRFILKKDESPFMLSSGFMQFFASAVNSNNKRNYGFEVDIVTSYSIAKYLEISCEADYFKAGDFFSSIPGTLPSTYKILGGVNFYFDNLD